MAAELVVKGKQVDEEDREHGTVSWRVVRNYVSGLGTWRTFAGLAAITALLHVFGPLTDVWLAMWTSDARKAADGVSDSNVYYMIGLVLITVVCTCAAWAPMLCGCAAAGVLIVMSTYERRLRCLGYVWPQLRMVWCDHPRAYAVERSACADELLPQNAPGACYCHAIVTLVVRVTRSVRVWVSGRRAAS